MNQLKRNRISKGIMLIGMLFSASLLFQSCSKKMMFMNSSVVPAAEGSVKIKTDDNNNYSIELKMMRLADPERLNPPKNTYVVWMRTEENGTKNIGQLKTSSGMFNSTLRSSLKTVSTFKPVGFFITAEDNGNVQQANGQMVITTNSN